MRKITLQVLILWSVSTALPAIQQCCDLLSEKTFHHETIGESASVAHSSHDHADDHDHGHGHGHGHEASYSESEEHCDDLVTAHVALTETKTTSAESIKFNQPAINSKTYYFDEYSLETVSFYFEHSLHRYQKREIYLLTSRLRI